MWYFNGLVSSIGAPDIKDLLKNLKNNINDNIEIQDYVDGIEKIGTTFNLVHPDMEIDNYKDFIHFDKKSSRIKSSIKLDYWEIKNSTKDEIEDKLRNKILIFFYELNEKYGKQINMKYDELIEKLENDFSNSHHA